MFHNIFSENYAIYEIMWKNLVQPDRPQMKIKATDTHSEYVILIAFPRQQWLPERDSMLSLYVHCLSCLYLYQLFFNLLKLSGNFMYHQV
jgi:hypothetical protein